MIHRIWIISKHCWRPLDPKYFRWMHLGPTPGHSERESKLSLIKHDYSGWNLESIRDILTWSEMEGIKQIPIISVAKKHKLVWPHIPSGDVTLKSVYTHLKNVKLRSRYHHPNVILEDIWKRILVLEHPTQSQIIYVTSCVQCFEGSSRCTKLVDVSRPIMPFL